MAKDLLFYVLIVSSCPARIPSLQYHQLRMYLIMAYKMYMALLTTIRIISLL